MKLRNILPYLLSAGLTGGVYNSALMAQTARPYDWQGVVDVCLDKAWLQSENPAGLVSFDKNIKSEIVLFGLSEKGKLKNYFSSKEEMTFGVQASSLCRLSDCIVVQGKVGYRNWTGDVMAGSYFIDPTQTPFDIVEYTDENVGKKQMEEYSLFGGVGAKISKRLDLGISLDYTAANYTKRKDLRHTNSLMDMTVVLGSTYHLGKRLDLGMNYHYHRRNETLLLSSYGTQGKTFVSLLNYGAFFGKQEVFGEIGYTKENETKPLFEEYHGGSVQFSWRMNDYLEWLSEISCRTRDGYYGDLSYSTVVYAEHRGNELSYKGVITATKGKNAHTFNLDLSQKQVENKENIYTYQNEETGRSYIEYLGEREVGKRTIRSLGMCYTGRYGLKNGLPRWMSTLDATFRSRDIKASNYPDYRRQEIQWWNITASATRNILSKLNCYSISVKGFFGGGSGESCQDGKYGSASEGEALTRCRNDLLMQEWEYLTNMQIGADIDCGYSRVFDNKGLRVFFTLGYEIRKAIDTEWLGDAMRHTFTLQIGCNF